MLKRDENGVPVIGLVGRLDLAGAQAIDLKFTSQTSAQKVSTVVDLSGTTFISSMGIRVLMQNAKALSLAGQKLVVAGAKGEVAEVLRIAGVTEVIDCFDSVDEALGALRS
ncbi:MAG: STAS domain-containing protein [Verrucomicrobiia bacterium]